MNNSLESYLRVFPQRKRKLRPWPIIRGFLIVQALTVLGGILLGRMTGSPLQEPKKYWTAHAISLFLCSTIGFSISGSLTRSNRRRYLAYVAIVVWLSDIGLVFFLDVTVTWWLTSVLFIVISAVLGESISYPFTTNHKFR